VVIGVHAPEFAFEKDLGNVARPCMTWGSPTLLHSTTTMDLAGVRQPVLARTLFIDAQGRIRGHHFGEGEYSQSEEVCAPADRSRVQRPAAGGRRTDQLTGVKAAADDSNMLSPETYVGYARAEHFSSPLASCRTRRRRIRHLTSWNSINGHSRVVDRR